MCEDILIKVDDIERIHTEVVHPKRLQGIPIFFTLIDINFGTDDLKDEYKNLYAYLWYQERNQRIDAEYSLGNDYECVDSKFFVEVGNKRAAYLTEFKKVNRTLEEGTDAIIKSMEESNGKR